MKDTKEPIVFDTVEEFKKHVYETNNIIFLNPFILEEILLRIIKKKQVAYKLVKICNKNYHLTVIYINEIEECKNHTFIKEQEIFHKLTGFYYTEITPKNLYSEGYLKIGEYKELNVRMSNLHYG